MHTKTNRGRLAVRHPDGRTGWLVAVELSPGKRAPGFVADEATRQDGVCAEVLTLFEAACCVILYDSIRLDAGDERDRWFRVAS